VGCYSRRVSTSAYQCFNPECLYLLDASRTAFSTAGDCLKTIFIKSSIYQRDQVRERRSDSELRKFVPANTGLTRIVLLGFHGNEVTFGRLDFKGTKYSVCMWYSSEQRKLLARGGLHQNFSTS
jgi:hypothetical protein